MSIFDLSLLWSALSIGFVGSGHCILMCGGVSSGLCKGSVSADAVTLSAVWRTVGLHAGRVLSYSVAGAAVGLLGQGVVSQVGAVGSQFLMGMSSLILAGMALHLSGAWRGFVFLERTFSKVWALFSPIRTTLLPVDRLWKSILMGMVWGWVPCGLVYSTLGLALASGSVVQGALVMICFGIGTVPVLILSTVFTQSLLSLPDVSVLRKFGAVCLAFLSILVAVLALQPGAHDSHGHESSHDHSHMNH